MSEIKYSQISSILANRIRSGFYRDRLPSTRALAQEFGVARQTLLTALQPLADRHLIKLNRGPGGITVNREAGKRNGLIGLVDGTDKIMTTQLYTQMEPIRNDGYDSEFIALPKSALPQRPEKLFAKDYAGIIFTNSSLSMDHAFYLEERQIPFVSASTLPDYPQLNYVSADSLDFLEQLAIDLKARGYRKVMLVYTSNIENFEQKKHRAWNKICKKHGLEILKAGRYALEPGSSCTTRTGLMLRKWMKKKTPPEAVILYTRLELKDVPLLSDPYWKDTVVIGPLDTNYYKTFPENFYAFRLFDSMQLYQPLWELLQEIMCTRPKRQIHRYVRQKLEYVQEPPCK